MHCQSDKGGIAVGDMNKLSPLLLMRPRNKRQRTTFSKFQLDTLEQMFQQMKYPDVYEREELARKLDLNESKIQVWFKNRRVKSRHGEKISPKQIQTGNKNAYNSYPDHLNTAETTCDESPTDMMSLIGSLGTLSNDCTTNYPGETWIDDLLYNNNQTCGITSFSPDKTFNQYCTSPTMSAEHITGEQPTIIQDNTSASINTCPVGYTRPPVQDLEYVEYVPDNNCTDSYVQETEDVIFAELENYLHKNFVWVKNTLPELTDTIQLCY